MKHQGSVRGRADAGMGSGPGVERVITDSEREALKQRQLSHLHHGSCKGGNQKCEALREKNMLYILIMVGQTWTNPAQAEWLTAQIAHFHGGQLQFKKTFSSNSEIQTQLLLLPHDSSTLGGLNYGKHSLLACRNLIAGQNYLILSIYSAVKKLGRRPFFSRAVRAMER